VILVEIVFYLILFNEKLDVKQEGQQQNEVHEKDTKNSRTNDEARHHYLAKPKKKTKFRRNFNLRRRLVSQFQKSTKNQSKNFQNTTLPSIVVGKVL